MRQYQYDNRLQINVSEEEAITICNWVGVHATHKDCSTPHFPPSWGNHTVTFQTPPSDEIRMRLKLYLGFDV